MLMKHTFSGRSTGKFPGIHWNFKKIVLFSRWKISGEKACSIYEFSQGITGSCRLFTRGDICATILKFGDKRINEWNLCQMEQISLDGPFRGSFRKFLVNGKAHGHSLMRTTSLMCALHSHLRALLRFPFLFGRRPNRVIEFACFNSKLQ